MDAENMIQGNEEASLSSKEVKGTEKINNVSNDESEFFLDLTSRRNL